MDVRLTHIGGPTVLIEFASWRLLTDPTFDPAGGRYRFGWGTGSEKLTEPAIAAAALGGDRRGPAQPRPSRRQPRRGRPGAAAPGRDRDHDRGGSTEARQAVELCGLLRPQTAIPIHYEGWRHFRQGREQVEAELARAPAELRERVRWLPLGGAAEIGV